MNKKSQLKIQEMAFMLVAVVILFVLAGLFFIGISYRDLYKSANIQERERAVSLIAKLADTPEFSNGDGAIDTDKLLFLQERANYEGFWPVASLEIRKIYPEESGRKCTSRNYPDCDYFKIYDSGVSRDKVSTFVALCRKEEKDGYWYDKCELGKIIAGVEQKTENE